MFCRRYHEKHSGLFFFPDTMYYYYYWISITQDRAMQQMRFLDSYTLKENVFSLFLNVSCYVNGKYSI